MDTKSGRQPTQSTSITQSLMTSAQSAVNTTVDSTTAKLRTLESGVRTAGSSINQRLPHFPRPAAQIHPVSAPPPTTPTTRPTTGSPVVSLRTPGDIPSLATPASPTPGPIPVPAPIPPPPPPAPAPAEPDSLGTLVDAPVVPPATPTPTTPPTPLTLEPAEAAIPVIPPPAPPIRAPYGGPEPRASDRFISAEDRARQREIDRENALARRTGRALNNAAANVSTTLASGTRKTGEVTARAGRAAVRTGVQITSTTAQAGAKTASGVALGIGQTAERIPQGVIDAVSPLSSVGYGGGVIPRVTPTTPSPAPTPIEVTAPTSETASPLVIGIGTKVLGQNNSEYQITGDETIAGVKLFTVQPTNGSPNIQFSISEKDLLNPTQHSRFRLAKVTPEPESVATPTPATVPALSPTPAPEPTTPVEETAPIPEEESTEIPLKIYSDEEGKTYELVEIDDHGTRVKYPDGLIHYVPKNLFDLYTSGEFFNPNAVLPPIETSPTAPVTANPALQTTTPIPGPGSPKRITNDQALRRSVEILDSAGQRAKGWQPTSTVGRVARLGAIATTKGAKGKATLARLTGFVKPDNPPDDDSS